MYGALIPPARTICSFTTRDFACVADLEGVRRAIIWVINLTKGVLTCPDGSKEYLPDAVVTQASGNVTPGKHSLEAP